MGRSLNDLAISMRKRAERIDALGNELKIIGAEAILRELVSVTPVDTSQAISNWQVGVGSRPGSMIPPYFDGFKGSTRGPSSEKAIDEGLTELVIAEPAEPVFVSNTAKYIVDLDAGSSSQFAGGFIPRALIVFRVAVTEAAARLLK